MNYPVAVAFSFSPAGVASAAQQREHRANFAHGGLVITEPAEAARKKRLRLAHALKARR